MSELSKRHQQSIQREARAREREVVAQRMQRVDEARKVSRRSPLLNSNGDNDAVDSIEGRRDSILDGQTMPRPAASFAPEPSSQLFHELYGDDPITPEISTRDTSSDHQTNGETSNETSNETTQILEHQLEDQRKARAELEQELTQKDSKIAQLEQELTEALTHEVESKTKEEAAPWRDRYERLRGILQRSEDEKKDLRRRLREAEDKIYILEGRLQRAERDLQKARDDLAEQTGRVEEEMARRRLFETELNNRATLRNTITPPDYFDGERARVDRRVSPTYSGGIPHHLDHRHYQSSRASAGSSQHELPSTDVPSTRAPVAHATSAGALSIRGPSTRTTSTRASSNLFVVRSRTMGLMLGTLT